MRDRFQPVPKDAAQFRTPSSREQRENIPLTSIRWLAGALEAGGTIGFAIQRSRGYTYGVPFIALHEPNESFVGLLKTEFGGSNRPQRNSWEWRLSGPKVAELAAAMEPYVVSRKEMVMAMQNWMQADTADRVQIAKDMKGYDRYQDGSQEEYEALVKDPLFVAGVLDNRGSIYSSSENGYATPRIDVYSKNQPLLSALKERYGGKVYVKTEAGIIITIMQRAFEVKKDSYVWTISHARARALIESVLDHLRIRSYDR